MTALFKKDRFDQEQEIMEIHSFSDIIKNYADMCYDGEYKQTEDDIHTTLHGFANLLTAHAEKMFETHRKVWSLDQYSSGTSDQPRFTAEEQQESFDFYRNIERERGNFTDGC